MWKQQATEAFVDLESVPFQGHRHHGLLEVRQPKHQTCPCLRTAVLCAGRDDGLPKGCAPFTGEFLYSYLQVRPKTDPLNPKSTTKHTAVMSRSAVLSPSLILERCFQLQTAAYPRILQVLMPYNWKIMLFLSELDEIGGPKNYHYYAGGFPSMAIV